MAGYIAGVFKVAIETHRLAMIHRRFTNKFSQEFIYS